VIFANRLTAVSTVESPLLNSFCFERSRSQCSLSLFYSRLWCLAIRLDLTGNVELVFFFAGCSSETHFRYDSNVLFLQTDFFDVFGYLTRGKPLNLPFFSRIPGTVPQTGKILPSILIAWNNISVPLPHGEDRYSVQKNLGRHITLVPPLRLQIHLPDPRGRRSHALGLLWSA